jgi:hypothetical protein
MKRIFLMAGAAMLCTAVFSQDLPKPSPMGVVKQDVGLTKVKVQYSRPGVKDRTIYGDLVPFDKMWRTGANKASMISFSTDVKINGKDLIAGDYALFSTPGADSWEIMFNTNLEQYGTGNYQDSEESLRISVKPEKHPFTETFTFSIDNITDNTADICMIWEETKVCMTMEVEVNELAEKNIQDKINEIEKAYGVYNTSARWYLDNGGDVAKALEWAQKSTAIQETFWNLVTLSRAQAANGKYKDAIATAEKSKKMSAEAGYDNYVKMNDENIAEWKKKK